MDGPWATGHDSFAGRRFRVNLVVQAAMVASVVPSRRPQSLRRRAPGCPSPREPLQTAGHAFSSPVETFSCDKEHSENV